MSLWARTERESDLEAQPHGKIEGIDPARHKETVDKLNECEGLRRLEAGEVDKVKQHYEGQVEIAREQSAKSNARVSELEQQLRVSEDKLDDFKTPRGRLKIKHAEYHMLDKVGLDVTETLEQMILDDKLMLNAPYQTLFFPDPMRGVRKHLTIRFSHGLKEFVVMVPEDTKLTVPFPYGEIVY